VDVCAERLGAISARGTHADVQFGELGWDGACKGGLEGQRDISSFEWATSALVVESSDTKGQSDALVRTEVTTVREEGFFALYKGLLPCWLRMAPWSLTFWLSYEQIRRAAGAKSW